jgi:phosphoglycolate phosphatase
MKTLILFDIDGTLIRSNHAGRLAMTEALEEVFGTAGPIEDYRFGGKTDQRIFSDLLTAAGFSQAEIQAKLPRLYDVMTARGRESFPHKGIQPCLGVPELLDALSQRPDALVGLLTGNLVSTAPLKLAAAGIEPTLFRLGAYGSDHMDRNALPQLAMERAAALTGCPFNGDNTVIVGDTPADILCARAGKATAVAVATGWHASETLAQYKPDHLLENLSDTERVLGLLLDDRPETGD